MTDKKDKTLKEFLEANLPAKIEQVLPKHLNLERFMRIAFAALVRNPELQKCTPFSVMECLIRCSEVGLEPDGRFVYLVPFKDKKSTPPRVICTFILGYMGMIQIARRTGELAEIQVEAVYEKDLFEYQYGTTKFLRHIPYDGAGDRGKMIHVWSFVEMTNGGKDFRVWRKDKVDEIRGRSRSKDNGPWVTDYEAMAKKSIFREHFKWLPFSVEVQRAVSSDDDQAIDIETEIVKPRRLRNTFADTEGFGETGDAPLDEETGAPPAQGKKQDDQTVPDEQANPFNQEAKEPELAEHKKPKGSLFS
jgi:recombination protein RecT